MQCVHKNRLHSLIGSQKHLQKVHKSCLNFEQAKKHLQSSQELLELNGPQKLYAMWSQEQTAFTDWVTKTFAKSPQKLPKPIVATKTHAVFRKMDYIHSEWATITTYT